MGYLFTAYFIIWLLLFAYMMSLDRKQKKLYAEIDKLKDELLAGKV